MIAHLREVDAPLYHLASAEPPPTVPCIFEPAAFFFFFLSSYVAIPAGQHPPSANSRTETPFHCLSLLPTPAHTLSFLVPHSPQPPYTQDTYADVCSSLTGEQRLLQGLQHQEHQPHGFSVA